VPDARRRDAIGSIEMLDGFPVSLAALLAQRASQIKMEAGRSVVAAKDQRVDLGFGEHRTLAEFHADRHRPQGDIGWPEVLAQAIALARSVGDLASFIEVAVNVVLASLTSGVGRRGEVHEAVDLATESVWTGRVDQRLGQPCRRRE
jgi:hypothetical protein